MVGSVLVAGGCDEEVMIKGDQAKTEERESERRFYPEAIGIVLLLAGAWAGAFLELF